MTESEQGPVTVEDKGERAQFMAAKVDRAIGSNDGDPGLTVYEQRSALEDNATLRTEVDVLRDWHGQDAVQITRLRTEVAERKAEADSLFNQGADLRLLYDELRAENERLKQENAHCWKAINGAADAHMAAESSTLGVNAHLLARNAELVALLREIEWVGEAVIGGESLEACFYCGKPRGIEHRQDCRLEALLAKEDVTDD